LLDADRSYKVRAKVYFEWFDHSSGTDKNTTKYGTTKSKRTGAVLATASTPTASSITSTTATIACNYFPNVLQSPCSAQLYYRKSSDSDWTPAGTANTTGGYSQVAESENITGLTSATQYRIKLVITRDTTLSPSYPNDNLITSAEGVFTTLEGTPTVTTNPASSVTSAGATLQATVDVNDYANNCNVTWVYNTTSPPDLGGTTVAYANNPIAADGSISTAITGLASSQIYYAKASVSWTSGSSISNYSGAIVSFTTAADPEEVAALEDHMLVFDYYRKYGVACDDTNQPKLVFAVPDVSTSSSDVFYTGAAAWAAATESQISKDAGSGPGAFADTTADPAAVTGATGLYSLALSATEMQCEHAYVLLHDAGAGVRDVLLRVHTHVELTSVDVDAATGSKANTTAIKGTGYGSGSGIQGIGGSSGKDIAGVLESMVLRASTLQSGSGTSCVLDASASTTNDYYNGSVIVFTGGTGAGQARVITDYVGGTLTCTLNKTLAAALGADTTYVILGGDDPWKVSPGAQLGDLPTFANNYADMLQFLFQRFVYKRTQTATVFTMYKDNGSDQFATGGVDDDGTTQTHDEMADA
jgi:hypothetical protein